MCKCHTSTFLLQVHDVGMGLLSDFGAIFVTSRPGTGADCVESFV